MARKTIVTQTIGLLKIEVSNKGGQHMFDLIKIGRFIKLCREERGLTQDALATKLNTTRQAVSNWECGRNLPECSKWEDIATILGVTIYELLRGERSKNPDLFVKYVIMLIFSLVSAVTTFIIGNDGWEIWCTVYMLSAGFFCSFLIPYIKKSKYYPRISNCEMYIGFTLLALVMSMITFTNTPIFYLIIAPILVLGLGFLTYNAFIEELIDSDLH